MKTLPIEWDGQPIRRLYDEATETWWFSVLDAIQILTGSKNARNDWFKLKQRAKAEDGAELAASCRQLKFPAAGGKQRLTDCATAESLLRIVQSIPGPRAEPIKRWLAKVGYQRMQELADPAQALDRARQTWQRLGRSDTWIQQRMTGQETHNKLIDYWRGHGVRQGRECAILTDLIHQEWAGLSVTGHKARKGLQSQNLRDHMSEAELIFTALAELSTRQIAERRDATGLRENQDAAHAGGRIARQARQQLEAQTSQPVVTGAHHVPLQASASAPELSAPQVHPARAARTAYKKS